MLIKPQIQMDLNFIFMGQSTQEILDFFESSSDFNKSSQKYIFHHIRSELYLYFRNVFGVTLRFLFLLFPLHDYNNVKVLIKKYFFELIIYLIEINKSIKKVLPLTKKKLLHF